MPFEKAYFDKNYHDYLRRNPGYKLEFYLKTIRLFHPKAKTLLDAGCAFGPFLKVASQNYQVAGFDISHYAIKQAQKILPTAKLSINSVEDFNLGKTFDVITLFDVIEHIPNINQALISISKHLNSKGIVVFVMPVYAGLTGKIVNLLDNDETHINKFTQKKWLEILNKDFTIIDWQGIFRYKIPGGPYIHFSTKRFRNIAPAMMVIASKK